MASWSNSFGKTRRNFAKHSKTRRSLYRQAVQDWRAGPIVLLEVFAPFDALRERERMSRPDRSDCTVETVCHRCMSPHAHRCVRYRGQPWNQRRRAKIQQHTISPLPKFRFLAVCSLSSVPCQRTPSDRVSSHILGLNLSSATTGPEHQGLECFWILRTLNALFRILMLRVSRPINYAGYLGPEHPNVTACCMLYCVQADVGLFWCPETKETEDGP